MNKRKCECCKAMYASGKSYGDFWQEFPLFHERKEYEIMELKGFCEFCNPNNEIWFVKDKSCHRK